MYDKIETLKNSIIHHGPSNNRVYLTKLSPQDYPEITNSLDNLAIKNKYTKIFAKIPAGLKQAFLENDYIQEACIPKFYKGSEDAIFLGKYFSSDRKIEANQESIDKILALAKTKKDEWLIKKKPLNDDSCKIIVASTNYASEMSSVYKIVFESYPFPIHEPEYLLETMKTHIKYFCFIENNKIISIASSEMDKDNKNVEMTDFATLPEYRGRSLASYLLYQMEKEMKELSFHTAYTIARAISPGMNITFAKLGYNYAGTPTILTFAVILKV